MSLRNRSKKLAVVLSSDYSNPYVSGLTTLLLYEVIQIVNNFDKGTGIVISSHDNLRCCLLGVVGGEVDRVSSDPPLTCPRAASHRRSLE